MRALNRPVSWWGWHWEPPAPLSIVEILRAGSISAPLAALFWVAMERGASLIVAADPPSAGKTTTLSALLSFTPPDTAVYFTRGSGETFELPPASQAYPTYILVNEMSDHLPVYTWGPYARRAFELLAQGYSLATTMHADSVAEVIGQLEGDLGIPRAHIANLTFILPLYIGYHGSTVRRVQEVTFLEPQAKDGFSLRSLARWDRAADSFCLFEAPDDQQAFARWAGLSVAALAGEMAKRAAFLGRLLERGTTAVPAVNQAIASRGTFHSFSTPTCWRMRVAARAIETRLCHGTFCSARLPQKPRPWAV